MELKIVHPWGNHPYWSFDIKEERWYNSAKKKCKKEMNLDLLPIKCEYHGYSSLRTVYPFIDSNLWDEAKVITSPKTFIFGTPSPEITTKQTSSSLFFDDTITHYINKNS